MPGFVSYIPIATTVIALFFAPVVLALEEPQAGSAPLLVGARYRHVRCWNVDRVADDTLRVE